MPADAVADLLGTGSYNGLTFGPGTDFHVGALVTTGTGTVALPSGASGMSGINDMPPIRTSDVARARGDGVWAGFDSLGIRTVHLEFLVIAVDNPTLYEDIAALERAFQRRRSGELPLLLFNSSRLINCRPRRRSAPYDTGMQARIGGMTVELEASDPRIYDAVQQSVTLIPNAGGGGVAWPAPWPWSWGGASTGGTAVVTNAGTVDSHPITTIYGPCTNPYVTNVSTGQTIQFSLVLASGDQLVLDHDAKSAVLNGTASRVGNITSDPTNWWALAPGAATIAFGAATPGAGCRAVVVFRSAWA